MPIIVAFIGCLVGAMLLFTTPLGFWVLWLAMHLLQEYAALLCVVAIAIVAIDCYRHGS